MPDTKIPSLRPTPTALLWCVSWPFFLFSVVLAGLLALSWIFLLPRYTKIEVGGVPRDVTELKQYKLELTAEVAAKEEQRRKFVLAVHDPAYDMLKERRRERVSIDELRSAVLEHARTVAGKENVIVIESFAYNADANRIHFVGDVRGVGPSSMTVLAEFALSLDQLPFIATHTTPAFGREEDPVSGPHSPFEITATLK